ncbi:DUF4232 domain-containing protein [Bifidobacterium mongoliense]|uniref:DUF4232 domain-containing protein n=1 Tax=Bifidobacterium mongoliense TaxID=518643 RepID=UPI0030EEEE75
MSLEHQHKQQHRNRVFGIAAALAVTVALAGCGRGTGSTTTPSASGQSPSSSSSSLTPAQSPSQSPSQSTTKSPAASDSAGSANGICSSSQLTASLGTGNGAAGSMYIPIVLTNHVGTCTMQGYPGVSLTAGNRQIGAAAERDSASASTAITLSNGQSAHATLRIVQAGNFEAGTCQPTKTDSIRIYPPDQREALTIATDQYTGCANGNLAILTISPLQVGDGK